MSLLDKQLTTTYAQTIQLHIRFVGDDFIVVLKWKILRSKISFG